MSKLTSAHRIHVYWFPPGTIGPTSIILDTGWYFSDECYSLCGPYSTEKLAITAYDSYVDKMRKESTIPRKLVKKSSYRKDIY